MEVGEKQILAKSNNNYIIFFVTFFDLPVTNLAGWNKVFDHLGFCWALQRHSVALNAFYSWWFCGSYYACDKYHVCVVIDIQLLLIHFILVVLVIFVILVMLVDCLTLKYRFMRMLINWYRTQANLQCKVCFIWEFVTFALIKIGTYLHWRAL